jgi:hypothetical protein
VQNVDQSQVMRSCLYKNGNRLTDVALCEDQARSESPDAHERRARRF